VKWIECSECQEQDIGVVCTAVSMDLCIGWWVRSVWVRGDSGTFYMASKIGSMTFVLKDNPKEELEGRYDRT